jgi:nonribosomal peptide synthetase protein BlmIV
LSDAVVLARPDTTSGLRLVAYVVSSQTPAPGRRELREALASALPSYMVPTAWVFLDRLPLTANGKVDQKALPEPTVEAAEADPAEAPAAEGGPGEVQATVARVWCEVLELPAVKPGDDFFELGGQSLSAAQVVARLQEALNLEVSMQDVFEATTLEALSSRLAALQGAASVEGDVESLSDDQVAAMLEALSARR